MKKNTLFFLLIAFMYTPFWISASECKDNNLFSCSESCVKPIFDAIMNARAFGGSQQPDQQQLREFRRCIEQCKNVHARTIFLQDGCVQKTGWHVSPSASFFAVKVAALDEATEDILDFYRKICDIRQFLASYFPEYLENLKLRNK